MLLFNYLYSKALKSDLNLTQILPRSYLNSCLDLTQILLSYASSVLQAKISLIKLYRSSITLAVIRNNLAVDLVLKAHKINN